MKTCAFPGCDVLVYGNDQFCIAHMPVDNKQYDPTASSGNHVDYYSIRIEDPTKPDRPAYIAECEDIIEALDMTFPEGEAFKSIWRNAAMRALGKAKAGDTPLRNAEKVAFFGERMVAVERRNLRKKASQ
jgi:hypothetical protein